MFLRVQMCRRAYVFPYHLLLVAFHSSSLSAAKGKEPGQENVRGEWKKAKGEVKVEKAELVRLTRNGRRQNVVKDNPSLSAWKLGLET